MVLGFLVAIVPLIPWIGVSYVDMIDFLVVC